MPLLTASGSIPFAPVPQVNTTLKRLSISSILVYAPACRFFVAVAPRATHNDRGHSCDAATYQRRGASLVGGANSRARCNLPRPAHVPHNVPTSTPGPFAGWCRLEQWCRLLVGGVEDVYLYTDEGGGNEAGGAGAIVPIREDVQVCTSYFFTSSPQSSYAC